MKKWHFTFESKSLKINLSSGSEAIFDSNFRQIYDFKVKNKFIISIADHRVTKKATCAIKCYGDVKLKTGKFCHFSDGDQFELLGKEFTVTVAVTPIKRKFSSAFSEPANELEIPEIFPVGWSQPGDFLMYYRPEDTSLFKSNKVAMFDIDWTIIKTKSNKTFPQSADDWMMWNSKVKPKLNELFESKTRIIFITNQNGMATGKTSKDDFMTKMEKLMQEIELQVEIFVSSGPGKFRKPAPGVFWLLKEFLHLQENADIIFVGDAAGRPANKILKKKKDFGASDRTFAMNCKIPFKTPDEYFLGVSKEKFEIPDHPLDLLPDRSEKLQKRLTDIENILKSGKSMLICVGYPGSGKSRLGKKLTRKFTNLKILCRDDMGSTEKCIREGKSMLKNNENIYIDSTNPDKKSRGKYIQIANENNVENIICLYFQDVDIDLARHNCRYRALNGGPSIADMILYTHRKKFEEPERPEGFTKIFKIPFVPKFKNDLEESLYRMHLPSL